MDLICQLLQVSEVPKTLCELIYRKSQGFPSWCEQLIKDAIYANTIQIIAKPSGTGLLIQHFETPTHGPLACTQTPQFFINSIQSSTGHANFPTNSSQDFWLKSSNQYGYA